MDKETVTIPLADRGNYYRGLLVLIRRDRVISVAERELMIRLGQGLDFDIRFCENSINELPKNPHIKAEAIKFSDKRVAESFLHDAVSVAFADGVLHPKEWVWLRAVAAANGLEDERLEAEIQSLQGPKPLNNKSTTAPAVHYDTMQTQRRPG